jgi:hypothetical protein
MRSLVGLIALAAPALAAAVPMQFTHQGRLADSGGVPLEGAHDLVFQLYAQPDATEPVWSQTIAANLDAGVFSVVLGGDGAPLDSALFDGSALWLGLAVDAEAELPDRVALVSVPYAVRANQAAVADSLAEPLDWSMLANVPEDADTLGGLACDEGQVPTWSGVAWDCASPVPASLDASTLVGTIDITNLPVGSGASEVAAGDHTHGFGQITGRAAASQLPVGTGSEEVAAGDHTHNLADLQGNLGFDRIDGDLPLSRTTGNLDLARTTGNLDLARTTGNLDIARTTGNIPFARLPVGTTASTVAVGNHTHTAAQVGALPIGGGTLTGNLAVDGRVVVGDDGAACNGGSAGSLRFVDSEAALYFCNGDEWILVSGSVGTQARPGASCKDILDRGGSSGDGNYWIRVGGRSFAVYCDMTRDGGGWTRFWWHAPGAGLGGVTDVLGQELWECTPSSNRCLARMPITDPTELHVQNELGRWATWTFNSGINTSNRIQAAFTARQTNAYGAACGSAFNASRQSSGFTESPYRCDEGTGGAADNCDCFWYDTYNGVKSFYLDDDSGWAETAFGAGVDNGNSVGVDALETGGYRGHSASYGVWLYYR